MKTWTAVINSDIEMMLAHFAANLGIANEGEKAASERIPPK